jgi:hypothetical protein
MGEWDRNTPWRQGYILTSDTAKSLGLVHEQFSDDTAAVVISHDCDLAQVPKNERFIEVIVGRFIEKIDGNFSHAKNVRILHLPFSQGESKVVVELSAGRKTLIPKCSLLDHQPEANLRLSPQERSILQRWLAARYRRAAFPDAFESRLVRRGLSERLARILKTCGVHLTAIYFDLDDGNEVHREKPDDLYTLTIVLLYSTEVDPQAAQKAAEEARKAIEAAFKAKCCPDGNEWQDIELRECVTVSDETMSVSQSDKLKVWRTDYLSLRDNSSQPILSE